MRAGLENRKLKRIRPNRTWWQITTKSCPQSCDRSNSNFELHRDLPNTPARLANGRFRFCRKARPTQAGSIGPRSRKARADPFRYHGPLELRKHTHHLKHGPPAGRGRIQPLGVQIKVNAEGVQFRKELD